MFDIDQSGIDGGLLRGWHEHSLAESAHARSA
jgi:hypothetical protein